MLEMFNKKNRKAPPETETRTVFDDIFAQLSDNWADARRDPASVAVLKKNQEEMLRKLEVLGPQIDASLKELERSKRELEENRAAFRQRIANIMAAGEEILQRQEEEVRVWRNSGCPTTSDVVAMKPLRLGTGTAMRA